MEKKEQRAHEKENHFPKIANQSCALIHKRMA